MIKLLSFCALIASCSLIFGEAAQQIHQRIDSLIEIDRKLAEVSNKIAGRLSKIEAGNQALDALHATCLATFWNSPQLIPALRKSAQLIQKTQELLWKSSKIEAEFFALSEAIPVSITESARGKMRLPCFLPNKLRWGKKEIFHFQNRDAGSVVKFAQGDVFWSFFNPEVLPL